MYSFFSFLFVVLFNLFFEDNNSPKMIILLALVLIQTWLSFFCETQKEEKHRTPFTFIVWTKKEEQNR